MVTNKAETLSRRLLALQLLLKLGKLLYRDFFFLVEDLMDTLDFLNLKKNT